MEQIIRSSREQIQEYFLTEALNQSFLKKLGGDLLDIKKELDSNQPRFKIGSAVDTLLTEGEEVYEALYYKSTIDNPPSEAVANIVQQVLTLVKEDYQEYLEVTVASPVEEEASPFKDFAGDLENWSTYIIDACETIGWNKTWGAEAKIRNITKDGSLYFRELISSEGKTILSTDEEAKIRAVVDSLKTHKRTKHFFDEESITNNPSIRIRYQVPIYFILPVKEIRAKALLDIVVEFLNEKGEVVMARPVDIKTTYGNTFNFPGVFKSLRYDIQAAWYTLALQSLYPTAKIEPFLFVVESVDNPGKPLVFEVDEATRHIGMEGLETPYKSYLGVKQLVSLYVFYEENGYAEEREIQLAKGRNLLVSFEHGISGYATEVWDNLPE